MFYGVISTPLNTSYQHSYQNAIIALIDSGLQIRIPMIHFNN